MVRCVFGCGSVVVARAVPRAPESPGPRGPERSRALRPWKATAPRA
ncbi:hypothetical protein SBD_4230 [Streptomyces bottropensis ATCC 25435]|uniref:Uncharacterized protein n=1 Tax=Streptomyces bottropensis ATCC 25435 TaxID=1054862 RepID=M3FNL9_9ACTN|nr:hypothetical protein SBD_4230 [Streptomyces bottropensis ATCC 25435]